MRLLADMRLLTLSSTMTDSQSCIVTLPVLLCGVQCVFYLVAKAQPGGVLKGLKHPP